MWYDSYDNNKTNWIRWIITQEAFSSYNLILLFIFINSEKNRS